MNYSEIDIASYTEILLRINIFNTVALKYTQRSFISDMISNTNTQEYEVINL